MANEDIKETSAVDILIFMTFIRSPVGGNAGEYLINDSH